MSGALLLFATGALAALGLGLIAISQKQHRRLAPAFGARPAVLRIAGAVLVGIAAWPAVLRDGPAFGLLVWVTMLTFSALAVVAGLTKRHGRRGGHARDD